MFKKLHNLAKGVALLFVLAAFSCSVDQNIDLGLDSSAVKSVTAGTQKTVYYFTNWTAANIHYQQDNGTWTTVPGVAMTKGADGWFTATINDTNGLVFCFNNGAGTWDSKNGANYSTTSDIVWVKNSTVYTSNPDNGMVGLYLSITNPMNHNYGNLVGLNVSLYKGDVKVGTYTIGTAEHSNPYVSLQNLSAGTYKAVVDQVYYNFSVTPNIYLYYKVEVSFELTASKMIIDPLWLNVYESAAYDVLVYFNPTFMSPINTYSSPLHGMNVKVYRNNVFFKDQTIVSGGYGYGYTPMLHFYPLDLGEYRIDLDSNADGYNYKGSVTFNLTEKGRTSINPSPTMAVTETKLSGKTIHYYNASFTNANIHYLQDSGSWTASPGVAMTKGADGWFTATIADEGSVTFCFNNGAGTWDSKGGSNYTTTLTEVWVKNSTIYTQMPTTKVTFKVSIPKGLYKDGIYVQVRGSKGPLSWTTGFDLTTITFGYDKDTFEGTLDIDGSFEYKYVLFDKPINKTTWENISGNRQGASGNTYNDTASF